MSGNVVNKNILVAGVNAFVCIIIGMSVAVIQPYKAKAYNIVDTVLILSVGLGFAAVMYLWIAGIIESGNVTLGDSITCFHYLIPLIYISGYFVLKMIRVFRSLQCILIKLKALLSSEETRRLNEMDSVSENTALVQ